jgi:hypothetical protein
MRVEKRDDPGTEREKPQARGARGSDGWALCNATCATSRSSLPERRRPALECAGCSSGADRAGAAGGSSIDARRLTSYWPLGTCPRAAASFAWGVSQGPFRRFPTGADDPVHPAMPNDGRRPAMPVIQKLSAQVIDYAERVSDMADVAQASIPAAARCHAGSPSPPREQRCTPWSAASTSRVRQRKSSTKPSRELPNYPTIS